ncbi:MAG: sodium ion-translocating decarboxylase subunit beta [Thermoplasmata archaeon HGW-Thermoplasmata-1]|nr:MAG: sodium ion-translocating decarboxylase subunit beta [Thermoplasmata archaeon HGW-Thermoplasmata-1]
MDVGQAFESLLGQTGFANFTWGEAAMVAIGCVLLFLAIVKKYEPLLLIPIAIGVIFVNIPVADMMGDASPFHLVYKYGIKSGLFPLIIFMGVGALTDFGPLLSNPKTMLLGAAAQFGIFGTLIGALALGYIPGLGIDFTLAEAASIGIIGGADGPTSIYTATRLAPHLLGPIAVAAYSYMALVPLIQPPIMRALTTKKERMVRMPNIDSVPKSVKILFPLMVMLSCAILIPSAMPLIGMLMLGNLFRECGVVDRLLGSAQNEIINISTIFLGIGVGGTMTAKSFLSPSTLGIFLLGLIAFSVGTATGVLFGKLMCKLSGGKVNPLIGAAGVSAVPMAARVVQKVGREYDPDNYLLMHAMGPNVAGVIGSAVAAGVLIAILGA